MSARSTVVHVTPDLHVILAEAAIQITEGKNNSLFFDDVDDVLYYGFNVMCNYHFYIL